jgi:hypothetical protein
MPATRVDVPSIALTIIKLLRRLTSGGRKEA